MGSKEDWKEAWESWKSFVPYLVIGSGGALLLIGFWFLVVGAGVLLFK